MSYPKNLGQRIQYITSYSTNSVKLNPDNSAPSLTDITSGSKLQFTQHTATHCNTLQHTATHCNTLPPNSLVDLSSFSVYADFSTTSAGGVLNTAARPHYLTRNANLFCKRDL